MELGSNSRAVARSKTTDMSRVILRLGLDVLIFLPCDVESLNILGGLAPSIYWGLGTVNILGGWNRQVYCYVMLHACVCTYPPCLRC